MVKIRDRNSDEFPENNALRTDLYIVFKSTENLLSVVLLAKVSIPNCLIVRTEFSDSTK